MASSLDSLNRNLVGVNEMMCNQCKSEAELVHIDENCVAHGMCGKCRDACHRKLEIDLIFDNLRVGHMEEQFRLLLRKIVYPYKYKDSSEKFEEKLPSPNRSIL